MQRLSKREGWLFGVGLLLATAGCAPASSSTGAVAGGAAIDRVEVSQIVVRYQPGAPPATSEGHPWGVQCVSPDNQARLSLGPSIGARLKVVTVDPPVPPVLAQLMALEMEQCPYIEWAEADVVRFDVPSAQDLGPAPTFSTDRRR